MQGKTKRSGAFAFLLTQFIFHYQLQAQRIGLPVKPVLTVGCLSIPEPFSCSYPDHFVLDKKGNLVHNSRLEVVDRFGNKTCKHIPEKKGKTPIKGGTGLQQKSAPIIPPVIDPDYVSPDGLFAVYLTNSTANTPPAGVGFSANQAARNTVAQVFADIEQLLVQNTSITEAVKFELKSTYFNNPALASASSYYDYNNVNSGSIINGEVWNAINLNNNAFNEWDGRINVNFYHPWRTEINAGVSQSGFDLYSVVLHEVMHALGFASGIDDDGSPRNGNAYLPYDLLLHENAGGNLVNQTGTFNFPLLNAITSGCPSNLRLGANDRFVYAPTIYANGTSLSHIDVGNNCNFPLTDYLMAPGVASNMPRRLHADEIDLLCELNYNLSNTYGHPNVVLFSNPAEVTAQSNSSNLINYTGCQLLVLGVNDFEAPGTAPTVVNCIDSTLSILESTLLANDVSTTGSPLQVSNLFATEGTITTTGTAPNRTFIYTPTVTGLVQLVYQPMDNNNNVGNYTYVNIEVLSCPGFDCTNSSSCNLICNPELSDFGNCTPTECINYQINYPNSSDCSSPNNFHIPGWASYFFSPDWMPNLPFTECLGPGSIEFNTVLLPNATGGRISFFSSEIPLSSGFTNFQSEVLTTNVMLQPNRRYILSYHKIDGRENGSTGVTSPGLQICLTQNFNPSNLLLAYSHNTGTGNIVAAGAESQVFDQTKFDIAVDPTIGDIWSQTILDFTTPTGTPLQYLSFYNLVDSSFTQSGNSYSNVSQTFISQLDRFELIEDHMGDLDAQYSVECGASANVGIELCTVSNMSFQWWDMTNNIQLTDGNVIVNASPFGTYQVVSINANGSVIGFSDLYSNINLELRRIIPNQTVNGLNIFNSVPAVHNSAQTTINIIGGGIPNDASFSFTVDASNCGDYTFQSNTQNNGETHQWDFQNDGVLDASGTTVNFIYPALGTYEVVHTVSNSCGTKSDTTTITISNCVIPVNCLWPRNYGSNAALNENSDAVVVDQSGNVFVHGLVDPSVIFENGTSIASGVYLAKYDSCGALLWVNDVQAYGYKFSNMKIDNLGNPIYLATTANNSSDSDISYFLTKFSNSNGNVIWSNEIEQWKYLPWPAFDIDMSNNNIYLVTNVNRYCRVKQSNGNYIINYTAPVLSSTYPKTRSFVIGFNPNGMQLWNDYLVAASGNGKIMDIVVGESTNRLYLAGDISTHPSNTMGSLSFGSNPSMSFTTTNDKQLFIASFTLAGNVVYSNVHPFQVDQQGLDQIEFSNTDNEIYLTTVFDQTHLFNASGNWLTTFNTSNVVETYFDQTSNFLYTCGLLSTGNSVMTGVLQIDKYDRTTKIWSYVRNDLPAKAFATDIFKDPTSNQVYFSGAYWDGDFSFNATDVMYLAGQRDAYVTRIKDQGSSVAYRKTSVGNAIEAQDELETLTVFPNPSEGKFKFKLDTELETASQVQVFDFSGRLLLDSGFEKQEWMIDLSSYANGVFQVVVKQGNSIYTTKVVKY